MALIGNMVEIKVTDEVCSLLQVKAKCRTMISPWQLALSTHDRYLFTGFTSTYLAVFLIFFSKSGDVLLKYDNNEPDLTIFIGKYFYKFFFTESS